MSQERTEEQIIGQELIDYILLEQEAVEQIATVLETGSYLEVSQAGNVLAVSISTLSELVEEIGMVFPEAREYVVKALLQAQVFQKYETKIDQAESLLHDVPEGIWLKIEFFNEYLQTVLAGTETFGLSEEELVEILEKWMPYVRIAQEVAQIELYTEFTPKARIIEAWLQNKKIPEVILNMLEVEFEAGKYDLQNRILDKKPHFFTQNSVPLEKITPRYEVIMNDRQLLLLAGTPAETIAEFMSKSVAVLDKQDVKKKMERDIYDLKYRNSIASIPWLLGYGEPLKEEIDRLGLTAADLKQLFTVSLNDVELAIAFIDIAEALGFFSIKEYGLITRIYIEHFLLEESVDIAVTGRLLTVQTGVPWSPEYLELFGLILEDLEIQETDPSFVAALERNQKISVDK